MKVKKGIIATIIILFLSNVSMVLANEVKEPVSPMTVGKTIGATFPDTNLASAVADQVAGGNVNAVLTQDMVNSCLFLYAVGKDIQNLTGIDVLVNLQYLFLSSNEITSLPDSIGNISALQELDLSYNQLNSLPDSLTNITGLRELSLSYNQLSSLPENLGNINSLQLLNVSGNQLTSLPNSIGNLANIQMLYLNKNQLTELPETIIGLERLEWFYIASNKLTSLPENIGNLASLNELDLSFNEIASIPESINNLSNLLRLNLYSNKLMSVPETIGNLNNLEALILAYNQIANLTNSIGNLSNLQTLSLDFNQLTSLPEGIDNLSNLQQMSLSNNILPSYYNEKLNTLGLNTNFYYEEQRQLILKDGLDAFKIRNIEDLININLFDTVAMVDGDALSTAHDFILENYVDENNEVVNINDYIQNGKIIKTGKVYAQVRAIGTGLFPNNSDQRITINKIQLQFESLYNLSFNLNGGMGFPPENQSIPEGTTGTAVANPTRDGFSFKGWNTESDGKGTNWIMETTLMPAKDVILYAQWEEDKNPVPQEPSFPNSEIDNNGIGLIKQNSLPQTGGIITIITSLLVLGSGLVISLRAFKMK